MTAPRPVPLCHPPGHFYSPIVDPEEVSARAEALWPKQAPEILGVDFRPEEHQRILRDVFPRYIADYTYPDQPSESAREWEYHTQNDQFGWLDSRALLVFLRDLKPKKVIEVGSGFSSLLTADVNRRWFDARIDFACVEPYPRPFLERGVPGITRLVRQRAELLDPSFFQCLERDDVLFIDSSHVSKTGSDVNYLVFEVLPRLSPGVRIHFHDIHLPREYQRGWVCDENRSWNEQYLLRALLMFSTGFRVMFGCSYAYERFPELVASALNVPPDGAISGGSLWLERT